MAKIRNVTIDYNRMAEIEEHFFCEQGGERLQLGANCIELHKAGELLAMACEDIVPDGAFSDYECCVWEEFRRVLRCERKEGWKYD